MTIKKAYIILFLILLSSFSFVYAKSREEFLKDKDKYSVTLTDNKGNLITGNIIIPEKPSIEVHGTEYKQGDTAKIWLQLLNNSREAVLNGLCFTDIYTPNNTILLEDAQMSNFNHEGVYYYDYPLGTLSPGVYPTIAKCYYTASQVLNYPTNFFINIGANDPITFTDMYLIDGSFSRFKEVTPSPRRLDAGLNFTSINTTGNCFKGEDFLTSISIGFYYKFSSVTNDDLQLMIYNYTSGSWLNLPNKLLETASYIQVSNSLKINNLTKSGIYRAGNGIILRFNDTTLTDGANSNLDIDQAFISCNVLVSPDWTLLKGSSEIHINTYDNISAIIGNISIQNNITYISNISYISNITYISNNSVYNNTIIIINNETNIYNNTEYNFINSSLNFTDLNNITGNILSQTAYLMGEWQMIAYILLFLANLAVLIGLAIGAIPFIYGFFNSILSMVLIVLFWVSLPILSYLTIALCVGNLLFIYNKENAPGKVY
jgi:hypothetical protein